MSWPAAQRRNVEAFCCAIGESHSVHAKRICNHGDVDGNNYPEAEDYENGDTLPGSLIMLQT